MTVPWQDPRWSLGWPSQLPALSHEGVIEPQGDWWVLRSPGKPRYYWGNFLLSGEVPGADYESVGFRRDSRHWTLQRRAPQHVAS